MLGRLTALEHELSALRVLGEQLAALAAAAEQRARLAEQRMDEMWVELAGLRGDLALLRDELVWAFARGQVDVDVRGTAVSEVPPRIVDLRSTGTAG